MFQKIPQVSMVVIFEKTYVICSVYVFMYRTNQIVNEEVFLLKGKPEIFLEVNLT